MEITRTTSWTSRTARGGRWGRAPAPRRPRRHRHRLRLRALRCGRLGVRDAGPRADGDPGADRAGVAAARGRCPRRSSARGSTCGPGCSTVRVAKLAVAGRGADGDRRRAAVTRRRATSSSCWRRARCSSSSGVRMLVPRPHPARRSRVTRGSTAPRWSWRASRSRVSSPGCSPPGAASCSCRCSSSRSASPRRAPRARRWWSPPR